MKEDWVKKKTDFGFEIIYDRNARGIAVEYTEAAIIDNTKNIIVFGKHTVEMELINGNWAFARVKHKNEEPHKQGALSHSLTGETL